MYLNDLTREVKQFGPVKTLEDIGLRALNRVMVARVLKGVCIERPDPRFLEVDPRYEAGFLCRDRLEAIVDGHPEYEMSTDFLEEAFTKGDECYGFLDGGTLAAYGWYSKRPTRLDVPGLMLKFGAGYVYMYKGFTHVRYRGQRLHAIGMTRALQEYLARGYRGIVSYVEWNNFSSLKSCYRMGYRDFGNIYVFRAFGRYLIRPDSGCDPYEFRVECPLRQAA